MLISKEAVFFVMAGYEDFVKPDYRPKDTDVIVSFKVKTPSWESKNRSYGAVASESSVGTWAAVSALKYDHVQKVAAKVFEMEKGWIKIAYPEEHFEAGNMPQILASIAGNVFGMKAVETLRLQDIRWTKKIVKSFPGPQFGIKGVRKIFGVNKRPLMLSVPKPKVGMTTEEHAQVGYDIWTGGLDLLKDDENLTSQSFNPFEKRVKLSLKMRNKAEKETGEKKSYLINVTSGNLKEMIRRAKFVAKEGGEYAMIDIITSGWTAVATLREECQDLGLAIHAHRAMHGAMTRNANHGISMTAIAEIARLLGVDQLHVGTAGVGKLTGSRKEVLEIEEHIIEPFEHIQKSHHHLTQDKILESKEMHCMAKQWHGLKPVFPVSSGGLHPILVPEVLKRMGNDIMLQIGGGVHGHPKGSYAGAKAMREAVEASMDGQSIEEKARTSKELKEALDYWGYSRPR